MRVALEGDLVYVHFECRDENGEVRYCTRCHVWSVSSLMDKCANMHNHDGILLGAARGEHT